MTVSPRWEKHMRSIAIVAALMTSGCASCTTADDTATPTSFPDGAMSDTSPNPQDSAVDSANDGPAQTVAPVHFYGRFDTTDPAHPLFAYPGSAIATRWNGTGIDVVLEDQGQNWFDVIVDNGAPVALKTGNGKTLFTLAQNLSAGLHDVLIVKRTEGFVGTVRFGGFTPKGGAIVPSPFGFTRRIEMIGDSITCGYGDIGAGPNCGFTADTENENVAWGAVAAKQLNAMHTAIAYSGRGIYRNNTGSLTDTMPTLWTRTVPDDAKSVWDFSRYVPDAVVINLATNDFAKGDPGNAFEVAYAAFLKKVRATYPNAVIVCALGPMLSTQEEAAAKTYVQNAIASAATTKTTMLVLPAQDGSDGYGCDYHPSAARQTKMAASLVAQLKQQLGW